MPHASVPRDLRLLPFRGRDAIGSGVLTRSSLRGRTWQRLLPDVYIKADVDVDHRAADIWRRPDQIVAHIRALIPA
jgi:hypothetical protein